MSSPTHEQLDELVALIDSDPGYATGAKNLGREVTEAEGAAVVEGLYMVTDQADAHIPVVAEQLGVTVACNKACPAPCCESLVLVSKAEATAIARDLARPEKERARRRFEARIVSWIERAGERAIVAAAAHSTHADLAYTEAVRAHRQDRLACPLHDEVLGCTVYSLRPLPCRESWVANTHEYCAVSDDPARPDAVLITHPERDELFVKARRTLAGVQNGMRKGVRREPLPIAVAEELARLDRERG